jgi:uncharacterized membrane protein YhaH (DUF805 family)
MFCPKCGKENPDDVKFCSGCGANTAMVSASVSSQEINFGKSITICMGKYANFKGRATRPEYWWFYLFVTLLGWGALIVDQSGGVSLIVNLALVLPGLSSVFRRLHDTNRSGWWMLIALTIIGAIPLYIWLASKGDDQANDYGNPV